MVQDAGLQSPEKALVRVPGKDVRSLRRLAIILARGCFFGDDVMEMSSVAGKGGLAALEPAKMDCMSLREDPVSCLANISPGIQAYLVKVFV